MKALWNWLFGAPFRLVLDGTGKYTVQNETWDVIYGGCYWNFKHCGWYCTPVENCWTDRETAELWIRRFNA